MQNDKLFGRYDDLVHLVFGFVKPIRVSSWPSTKGSWVKAPFKRLSSWIPAHWTAKRIERHAWSMRLPVIAAQAPR